MHPLSHLRPWQTFGISALAALALAALGSCGSEAASAPDTGDPGLGRYLPLTLGASWTWRVTPSTGDAFDKVSTVEAFEDVGGAKAGVMAFRVRTAGKDGTTISWQEDTGSQVLRHREQSFSANGSMTSDQIYMPYKLRVDESAAHMAAGATFAENYTEVDTNPATGVIKTKTKAQTWTVEAVNEQLTVPAGTFVCVRLRRVGTDASASDKQYWFARGVGKIKEAGGQTEELAAFTPGTP